MSVRGFLAAVKPHWVLMGAVYAGAMAAGWAMLPGNNERVAMLERDGHSREALEILEQQFAGGDRSYRTLYQMQALYESEGNSRKSGELLEMMSKDRPRDAGLARRLAQFYKQSQDEAGYVRALQSQINIRYSELACRELAARLRLMGDFSAEQSALQGCRQKGYRRPDDLARLAELAANDGDIAQSAGLLRSIDDLKRLNTAQERYLLLSMLLEQEQPKEAERRALRWIRASKDDTQFAVGLIDILARSKFAASAIEVAKDAGAPGDAVSLTVAERLIEQTQFGAARLYLRGWLERANLNDDETALRFVEAGLVSDDAATAFKGAQKFGFERLPPEMLLRLAAALDTAGLIGDAAEVRTVANRLPGIVPGDPVPSPASLVTIEQQPEHGSDDRTPANAAQSTSKPGAVRDPLDGWRRILASKMSDDAQHRMQALVVGPPRPHTMTHHFHLGRSRDTRLELRSAGSRFLKKTSRVLQRAKKNRVLKAIRKPAKDQAAKPASADAQLVVPKSQKTVNPP